MCEWMSSFIVCIRGSHLLVEVKVVGVVEAHGVGVDGGIRIKPSN